jgi:hypothetical protein
LGATAGWQDVWNQIKPLLSNPGTVNDADNPVHWTKLKGVPAGFADGTGIAARFRDPAGLTTDGVFVYVADGGNSKIRRIR